MAVMTVRVARHEPVLSGRSFGSAGAYEKAAGTLHFAVDPAHPLHAEITDLDRAPRNGAGLVEFSADFYASRDDYLARVRAACAQLVALRHMLAEDVEAVVARAARQYDHFQTLM